MLRYEVLEGTLQWMNSGEERLTFALPVREAHLCGLCVTARGSMIDGGGGMPPAVSIMVGDGQPIFEGYLSVQSKNRRVLFTHEFIDLRNAPTDGAELSITPICPSTSSRGSGRIALSIILQYDEKQR